MKLSFIFNHIIIVLLIFELLIPETKAQSTFEKVYGFGDAHSIQETADGNIIIGATILTQLGICLKINSVGDSIWQRDFPYNSVNTAIETNDGMYMIGGATSDYASSGCLVKLNQAGDSVWGTNYSLHSSAYSIFTMIPSFDNGYIVGYNTQGLPGPNPVHLMGIDSSGYFNWSEIINPEFSSTQHSGCLIQTNDSNYASVTTNNSGGLSIVVTKTLRTGGDIWNKNYFDTAIYNYGFMGDCILQAQDSTFLVFGTHLDWSMSSDRSSVYIMKLGVNGDSLFTKKITFPGFSANAYCAVATNDGGYLITGEKYHSADRAMLMVKVDSNLDTVWTKQYYGLGEACGNSLIACSDGGFIVAGSTKNPPYGERIYVIKTDSLGNLTTGIINLQPEPLSIFVFPNPNNSLVTISSSNSDFRILSISNENGTLVKSIYTDIKKDQNFLLNVSDLCRGLYLIRIKSGNKIFAKKLIVE